MTLLLSSSLALAAGLADCPRSFDTREITDAADSAEASFSSVDVPGFTAARSELLSRLACAREPLSPQAIARVHRVQALGSQVDGKPARVPQALAALFAAEPGHQMPTTLVPDGHPVRQQITPAMMALRDDPGFLLPVPASGWIEAEGTAVKAAPVQRAAVLQQVDGQGQVVATHYWWPDEASVGWLVPVEKGIDTGAPAVAAKAPREPSAWGRRAPFLAATGASLVASGVLFAMAADGRAEFDAIEPLDESATDEQRSALRGDLGEMQAEVNTLAYASYAAAGVGVGLGVVTVIVW